MEREHSVETIALFETHTGGTYAKKIIKRVGFDNHFIQDPRG